MAKHYTELEVAKWNVKHFQDYMRDLHQKRFGIDYHPAGGWQRESGLLGGIIGTAKKPAKYDKEVIKDFITRCFETYTPTAQYPGTSFMFIWSWRKNVLQQVELEHKRKVKEAEVAREGYEGLDDWF